MHTCPNCGYCPCCGRANPLQPKIYPAPAPWTTPWYPGTGTAPAYPKPTIIC